MPQVANSIAAEDAAETQAALPHVRETLVHSAATALPCMQGAGRGSYAYVTNLTEAEFQNHPLQLDSHPSRTPCEDKELTAYNMLSKDAVILTNFDSQTAIGQNRMCRKLNWSKLHGV